ncbi:MAG: hypothetical protein HPKKFMNG_00449 [Planctomycetes bacterium]|nr:hypothetical protein [Planctomycetota bacterium]HRJ79847.1 class I SAM-dependent methyltransferase [Planctomycetota bacterium]
MSIRSRIYDWFLLPLTSRWYGEVLNRLSPGSKLLDIGIGTGGALASHAGLLKSRGIHVTGLDIDPAYVRTAIARMAREALTEYVEVRLEPIQHHQGGPYDAAYFSGSFMLMPDPDAVLRHVRERLTGSGRVFFTQSFQRRRSPVLEWIKPRLRRVTTVDFGQVSYEESFFKQLQRGGLDVIEDRTLRQGPGWSQRLIVAERR